jgi:hypothetical protein
MLLEEACLRTDGRIPEQLIISRTRELARAARYFATDPRLSPV